MIRSGVMQIVFKSAHITAELAFPIYTLVTVPDLNFKLD
jgi:hypothetical protein